MSHEPDNVNATPPPGAMPDPLAEALARLEPAPARLDRDALLYAAGAESRRSTIRLWQLTAGFLAAVGFMAGMAAKQPPIVYIDRDSPPADVSPKPPAPATNK